MTVAVNKPVADQRVYLPWTNADNSLFCITYKIGPWRSRFSEQEYKTIIAESLNVWVNLPQLKQPGIKIAGYLISSSKLCLVLFPHKKITPSVLELFFAVTREEIEGQYGAAGGTAPETAQLKIRQLFGRLPFTSPYVTLLVTGREVNIPYYNPHLERLKNYIRNYNFCSALDYAGGEGPVEVCLLQAYRSPFYYPVGICYQPPKQHAKHHQALRAELNSISEYFSLIRTFSCTNEEEKDPEINELQQLVIDFVRAFRQRPLQLIMACNNSALAHKDKHGKWAPGLMTKPAYAEKWVQRLLKAFGSREALLKHLTCITLGNEPDAYGPHASEKVFESYYRHWIPEAFSNLKKAMAAHGLQQVPLSVALKNYPIGDPPSSPVAFSAAKLVYTHWSSRWNGGKPFVFFGHYTPDEGHSTDFRAVERYFNNAQEELKDHCQVFVGQTGYSAENGAAHQAQVIGQLFRSLYDQYGNYRFRLPVCIFEAFDRPGNPKGKREMGLFERTKENNCRLKAGIVVPAWVSAPVLKQNKEYEE